MNASYLITDRWTSLFIPLTWYLASQTYSGQIHVNFGWSVLFFSTQ